jgi:hypothetical protein
MGFGWTMGGVQSAQDAYNYDRQGISKLKAQDQADAIREGMRMRELTRKQQELSFQQQQQSLADRTNPDGSIRSDAEYAQSLKEREGNFNDQLAQRGWQTRQAYAEQQRQKINNEQRASATELAQQRMGRRVNVAIPTAS